MIAPNGAYKNKSDHAELPLTISETVRTAKECYKAGADAIHTHVRDENGKHSLDPVLYKKAIKELRRSVPQMLVQITTEAAGRYSPAEQRQIVYDVKPVAVSVAVRELLRDEDLPSCRDFYFWADKSGIKLQHILYSDLDVVRLDQLIEQKTVPDNKVSVLFVLGRYSENQASSPQDLQPFLQARRKCSNLRDCEFMVCAFGNREIECLAASVDNGGNCRIGFENNLYSSDGTLAESNAERVADLILYLNAR